MSKKKNVPIHLMTCFHIEKFSEIAKMLSICFLREVLSIRSASVLQEMCLF